MRLGGNREMQVDNLSLDRQQACKTVGMGVGTCNLRTQEAETHEDPLGLLANQPSQIYEL